MSDCVLIGGVFDPLHAGHLAYIEAAKPYGPLHCCISTQSDRHPYVLPVTERARLIQALGGADAGVTLTAGGTVAPIIRQLLPRAYVKGKDWDGHLPEDEVEACAETGTQIIFVDTVTQSSSRMLADYQRRLTNSKTLAFEKWVLGQKPAETPWQPVTDYSFEARREIEAEHVKRLWQSFGTLHVLDYGCGYGHLVRLMRDAGMSAFGYEPYIPVEHSVQQWAWGLHTPNGAIADKNFDVVICREVLEHLTAREIAAKVRVLCAMAKRYVYLTTRFTSKAHLLDFDTADGLDPTHISMLNQDFLRTLFVLEGCRRRPDLEETLDWQKKHRVLVYEVARG